jgi:galactose oxidase
MQPGVVRPAITSVTPTLRLGGTYIAGYTGPAAITGASLTKLGSATHSVDSNQRKVFVGVAPAGAGRVSLRIEANWGILPLGAYMLTLTDSRRIPSKSVMVQVVRATPTAAASGIDQSAACCCC